jgi:hypothetical protein
MKFAKQYKLVSAETEITRPGINPFFSPNARAMFNIEQDIHKILSDKNLPSDVKNSLYESKINEFKALFNKEVSAPLQNKQLALELEKKANEETIKEIDSERERKKIKQVMKQEAIDEVINEGLLPRNAEELIERKYKRKKFNIDKIPEEKFQTISNSPNNESTPLGRNEYLPKFEFSESIQNPANESFQGPYTVSGINNEIKTDLSKLTHLQPISTTLNAPALVRIETKKKGYIIEINPEKYNSLKYEKKTKIMDSISSGGANKVNLYKEFIKVGTVYEFDDKKKYKEYIKTQTGGSKVIIKKWISRRYF